MKSKQVAVSRPNELSINSINGIRTLTVSAVYREWGALWRRRYSWVPALRLQGHWLGAVGFKPGQKVEVIVGADSIVIASKGVRE